MINSSEPEDPRTSMGRHSAEPADEPGLVVRRDERPVDGGGAPGTIDAPTDQHERQSPAESPAEPQPHAGHDDRAEASDAGSTAVRAQSPDAGAVTDYSQPVRPAAEDSQVAHWRRLTERRTEKVRRKRPWWVELPILIVVAFLLTFLIQTFVARVYYVPSGSMEQTLHGTEHGGDRILAFKTVYDFRDPKPGEVVVFRGPATWTPEALIPGPSSWLGKLAQSIGSVVGVAPPNEKDFVKRVIAVGGQTIRCCDEQGRVQVDGQSLDEPYLYFDPGNTEWEWINGVSTCAVDPNDPTRYPSRRCFGPYTVPDGMLWVMGDHRSDSADSTAYCRGLVPSPQVHCQGPIPVDNVIGKAVFIVMPPSRWGTVDSPDLVQPDDAGSGGP